MAKNCKFILLIAVLTCLSSAYFFAEGFMEGYEDTVTEMIHERAEDRMQRCRLWMIDWLDLTSDSEIEWGEHHCRELTGFSGDDWDNTNEVMDILRELSI